MVTPASRMPQATMCSYGLEAVGAVEREAVHRHALGDADADGRDLVGRGPSPTIQTPDASLDPHPGTPSSASTSISMPSSRRT